MNATQVLLAINAGLSLVESLLPLLQEMSLNGIITPEQQQEVLTRYNSLKNKADGQFTGPEWQLT